MRNLFTVFIASFIGITFAVLITENADVFLINDFSRIDVILDSLPESDYEVAVFGNSSVMNGIDARQLEVKAKNFASSGQGLKESVLLYQELVPKTKKVIQFLDPRDLIKDGGIHFKKQTIQNYLCKRYEPNEFTTNLLGEELDTVVNNFSLYEMLKFKRVLFQSGINTLMRNILKRNSFMYNNYNSLTAPYMYSDNEFVENITLLTEDYNSFIREAEPDEKKTGILLKCKALFKENNIEYILILNPLHPDILKGKPERYQILIDEFEKSEGLKFYNWLSLLDEKDFIDHLHANSKGRDKMSKTLNEIINN